MNKLPDEYLIDRFDKKTLGSSLKDVLKQAQILLSHSSADIEQLFIDDVQKLLIELQEIELKIQTEEIVRARHVLSISRDCYEKLYDSAPVAYLTLNESGRIQQANIATSVLLGCSKETLINKKLEVFIHPSDQDNYRLFIHKLLTQNIDQVFIARLKDSSNSSPTQLKCHYFQICSNLPELCNITVDVVFVECCAKVVFDDKNALQICVIITNVTEHKQAQETIACLNEKLEKKIHQQTRILTATNLSLMKKVEELRRSKHQLAEREIKLHSIFNASVEGIITINLSSIIVSANAAVKTIFGYTPEELMGCNINKLMPLLGREVNAFFRGEGKILNIIREIEGMRKNGTTIILELSLAEYSIDNAHYFTHIVRDVSLRKQRERQNKKHLNELAHVTRLGLMGEMASGIAHELNQPLSAISSYTQVCINLINTENPDLVELAEILYKTQQQALRAGQIIHRMREFVKSHAKHRVTVDINMLIHEAVGLCVAELKQSGINLIFELGDSLPLVYVDHIQIEQVIINLIRNSIDALQNIAVQQRQLTIHSDWVPNKGIQVSIKDNGQGLNEDQQQKILTPFYTTKPDGMGMGMGLSISRSLIEAHEGTLHFTSQHKKGTTFYFTLPIAGET